MSTKQIIIPKSWYKLYRSKLQLNENAIPKNIDLFFNDINAEYIFKFPKTTSYKSTVSANAYFYDTFKIKGNLTIDCNDCNFNMKINPLKQEDNKYPWTSYFDYLTASKLKIQNANNLFLDISPTIYHIGKVPHFSPLSLKEIEISASNIGSQLSSLNQLNKVTIILPDKTFVDNSVQNYSHFDFINCKNLKVADFSKVGKNNYLDINVDKKTNQDLTFKFNKNQVFTPHTLATFLHMNNGFVRNYFNGYKITDLMDIKSPTDIIKVKYSDMLKKLTKKYPKIVEEVIKGEKTQSDPIR